MPRAKEKSTEKKTDVITWGPVSALLVVFAVYVASQILAAVIVSLYPVFKHWNMAQSTQWLSGSNIAQFWLTVFVEASVLLMLWLFLKSRATDFNSLGLKGHPRLIDLGYVLVGFGIYFGAYIIALQIVHVFAPHLNVNQKQDLGFSSSTVGSQLWLVFISLVLLPPIVEEILFRGFLYSGLKVKLPKIASALIVSVIFASLHLLEGTGGGLLWVAGIDTFILSLVLVYLREVTDRLWASMGLHMLKNAIAFAGLFIFHWN
ncbi:MAG TPA: CPBP family intramembrane glutamic endopeptidase [Candidatus Saccharimonadales bacterium]|nr:CPBP family intramembrane glutamic endopeptidase [Candidatus Saccharimonadales bacterium]